MTRRKRTRRANGAGSIYQRSDGRWVGRGYLLMPDGTSRRRDFYGATEEEARDKLTAAQARSTQGIPAEATGWTVERFLGYWLEHIVKPARKPKTYQGYEVVVRVWLVPRIGRRRLNKLTAGHVRLLLQQVANTCLCCLHGTDAARPAAEQRCCAKGDCCQMLPSDRLREQIHAVLRNALQAAVREELLGRNVARLVQVSGPVYDVDRGLSLDQAKTLLRLAKADRLHALYVLALYLGLRRGELLGLWWDAVDLDAGVLVIRQTLQRVDGELRIVRPKTRRSSRTVPLPGFCVEALRQHQAHQEEERADAGTDWVQTEHVFTSRVGTPIEPDNLRRSWYPLRAAVGIEDKVFHGLRHSCVTLLLEAGVPPHVVRDIVGHADIEVTMTIYAHVSLDEKRAALKKLDQRLRD